MSAPALEGGQDDDDILGFPGDGFVDKTDVNPGVPGEQDEEGDDARSFREDMEDSDESLQHRRPLPWKRRNVCVTDGVTQL
jgi:hypothetical protein